MSNVITIPSRSNNSSKPLLKAEDLRQFYGDIIRFTHPLNRSVIYSPGVRYVAEKGHAYWLIDAIVSYFGSPEMKQAMAKDYRLQSLQFWRLTVTDSSAVLTAEADAGEEPFIRQEIAFTDFPLDAIDIWAGFDGAYWTLYLPSEH
jgi:hypothetical protein